MQLRDYQSKAIEKVRQSISNGCKSSLLVLPTGSGKTFIFAEIVRLSRLKNKKVLVLVHKRELIKQTCDELKLKKIKHGIIAAGFKTTSHDVYVASVQTLINRLNNSWQPDLIILDEAHHAVARSWRKILDYFSNTIKIGVTATPMRMTGAGLGEVFDDLIIGSNVPFLQDKGYLAKCDVYAPPNNLNFKNFKKSAGDFARKEVEEELDKVDITGDAVQNYLRIANNRQAIAFCISVKHGQSVTKKFKNAGISAELITGSMNIQERDDLVKKFGNNKVRILVSVDVVSEGFNIPACGVAILLRPTASEALYLQQVGRVLRPQKNKIAIVLDHVGNTKRHGFVDEERLYSLDQKAKSKRKGEILPAVETCKFCFATYKPQPRCPQCGHEKIIEAKQIIYKDGELEKMKKTYKLELGDPIREKSTGAKLYFYGWSDDWNKTEFRFTKEQENTKAQCFTEGLWQEYKKADLHNIFNTMSTFARKKKTKMFWQLNKKQLVEIDDILIIREERDKLRRNEEWQCKTLYDWQKLAEKRGYSSHWARIRFYQRKNKQRRYKNGNVDNF
tara:strand:+ start:446 stop:2128 length:1683 start_codon:yes stop_codon:yes gene_type:complete